MSRLLDRLSRRTNERLVDGVWWLRLGWVPPLMQNVYLVDDEQLTLVDAGLPWDADDLRTAVRDAGYELGDVERVLVTHYDLDHVGALRRLGPELDAPVYMGAPDLALVDGDHAPPLSHPKGVFHRVARRLLPLPSELDLRPLEDGDAVGGFVAYHTPGHNPGHTVYVHEGLGAAFLGDLVWGDDGALTTPIWLDSYDMGTLADSVRELDRQVPEFELACMGHGRPLREGGRAALAALAASL